MMGVLGWMSRCLASWGGGDVLSLLTPCVCVCVGKKRLRLLRGGNKVRGRRWGGGRDVEEDGRRGEDGRGGRWGGGWAERKEVG